MLSAAAGNGNSADRGVLATCLHSDGRQHDLLFVDGGPSSSGTVGHVRMEGREVFKHAVRNLASVIGEVLDAAELDSSEVDWLVPHQANRRIIATTAKKLDLSDDKIVMTIDRHGNTSAASVPLALNHAVADGRITPGDIVILEAMGGGLTWGASAIRW